MTKLLLSTIAAGSIFAVPAVAATLTIDTFDAEQRVNDAPDLGVTSASQVSGDNIIGGFRDLQAENTVSQGNNTGATQLQATAGSLTFSNDRNARGVGTVTYDGNDDAATLDTAGLGGVNLLIGDNPRFFSDVPADGFDNNANADFTATAYDTFGNTVSFTENLSAGFNPELAFSMLTGDDGFDFSSVGALQFQISTTDTLDNIDGQLNGIEVRADDVAPIPLPASGLLLLAGLGGFGALRRSRKA